MSSWQGSGPPAAVVEGTLHVFPHVSKGVRKEEWKPEVDESWVNLDGETIEGDRRFRFRGEYTWESLSNADVQLLARLFNQRVRVNWRLHLDTPSVQPWCRIVSFDPAAPDIVSRQSVVTLVVESLSLVDSIPIPSLEYLGAQHPLRGVLKT